MDFQFLELNLLTLVKVNETFLDKIDKYQFLKIKSGII